MNISTALKVTALVGVTAGLAYVGYRNMMRHVNQFRADAGVVTADKVLRAQEANAACEMSMSGMSEKQKDDFYLSVFQAVCDYENAEISFEALKEILRTERAKTLMND